MSSKLKLFIGFILIASLIGFGVFKYINKASDDFSTVKAEQNFTFGELIEKTNSDTTSLNQLRGKIISIKGFVKKISSDEQSKTIELGDSTNESSIICQLDQRHLNDFTSLKENDDVNLKGKLTGYTIDTDLGLGNTIELNYCTKN